MSIYIYIYVYIPPPQGLPFHLYSLEKLTISKVGGEHIYITVLEKIETSRAPKDAFGRVVPRKDRNLYARSQKTTL